MSSLYWRLGFPDDSVLDEPEDGGSISLSRPGASAIIVTRRDVNTGQRTPVVAEPLDELGAIALKRGPDDYMRDQGCTPWYPVFYRKRGMVAGGKPTTQLTVFGRARVKADGETDGKLWAIGPDGRVVSCPDEQVDFAAVDSLLERMR